MEPAHGLDRGRAENSRTHTQDAEVFVFLREHRHALLDADFQHILAQSYSPEPSGQEPVDAGLLALATLLQAYGHVGDRDAVALTVMDKRWQLVLDCLGAEHPPFSQGTCATSGCG